MAAQLQGLAQGLELIGVELDAGAEGRLQELGIYTTASYQAKDLQAISLNNNDLSGWNFGGQNLAHAHLDRSTLTGANLSNAVVKGTSFWSTTSRGFTAAQLYSTASYFYSANSSWPPWACSATLCPGLGLVGMFLGGLAWMPWRFVCARGRRGAAWDRRL